MYSTRMSRFPDPFTAAVVQWAPSVNDAAAGTARACAAIEQAAAAGARLVVFPETWLTGYPYFEGNNTLDGYFDLWREFVANAVRVDGPEIAAIVECAADHGTHVVIGVNERDHTDAVYNSLVYVGDGGTLLGHHRKLVPTITEKLVWTPGDGSDLDAYDTPLGTIGGLICYEHQMAPARYVCCSMGVQIHVSVWPGHATLDGRVDAAVRHLATENACFVLSAREVMSASRLPPETPQRDVPGLWDAHGGSAIVAPGGQYLVEPTFDVETIVTAEIDVAATLRAKWWVNGVGNYARPDVFQVVWDRRPKPPVRVVDGDEPA